MASQRIFAEYVLKEKPTPADVDGMLSSLGRLLQQQMRRRGVWHLQPSRWEYAGETWRDQDTFNDLLYDCFADIFDGETGKRLARLRQYARQQPSIDGAVRRAVWNFLNEKERRKNPAAHAVFKNIQAAVAEALADGRLTRESATIGEITNETVVAPSPQSEMSRCSPHDELRKAVAGWSDGFALCGRMTKRSRPGLQAAAKAISRLENDPSGAWRVGDLVEAVKQALPSATPGSLSLVPDPVQPFPAPVAGPETFDRIRKAIECLHCREKVKKRLRRLWEWMIDYYDRNHDFPKQSEVGDFMDSSRQRVSEDYDRLRKIIAPIWDIDPDK